MSALSYKTRGNSSPQGKAKVYLSYHPSDAALLDGIIAEILAEVNCAVFYRDAEITDTEAHLHDLAEMNLTVIPISAAYLTKPSLARDTELPFFKEKHLPILPLMQEEHLDEEFNAVFGDLQYLDKNAKDTTAISYEEKFKTYLTSILVGDELAARIRQAFDAYIFLSYRKKDRVYAKELMRLIHENDFCRDIAIWYDEFLTPGEDFNDTIADALKKSTLFALAVTPNLVNERNYVMTVEYPMAKDENKTVLPVELVPTDRESLKNAYNGITEAIDSRDPAALQNALLDAFQWVMLRSHDDDPEHLYLIGLAYLSGIDVEKNASRALELITSAAERDYPDAIKKLVSMYENGEGVMRDHEKQIVWQEKLVAIYYRRFEEEKSEDSAGDYLAAISGLCRSYENVTDYDKAKLLVLETLVFIDSIENIANDSFLDKNRAICYEQLGQYCRETGDLENANRYQNAMKHHSERLQQSTAEEAERIRKFSYAFLEDAKKNPAYDFPDEIWNELEKIFLSSIDEYRISAKHQLAQSYTALGYTALTENKIDTALDYFTQALTITQELCQIFNTNELQRELAIIHSYLGDIAMKQSDVQQAYQHFLQAYSIFQTLVDDSENDQDTACVLHRISDVYELSEQLNEALELKKQSLALRLRYVEKTGTVHALESLAASYGNVAFLLVKMDQTENALAYAKEAFAILDDLTAKRHQITPQSQACYDAIKRLIASLS